MRYITAVILLLLLSSASSQTICPVLCTLNCFTNFLNNFACPGCYSDFAANSTVTSTCGCPISMFSQSNGLCYPCPITCTHCSSLTQCTQCIPGYMISNNFECIPNITNSNGWVSKNVSIIGLNYNRMGIAPLVLQINGHQTNITHENTSPYDYTCLGMQELLWFGGKNLFNYNTKIFKTIYNLPQHQWINVMFQLIIIDQWKDYTMLLQMGAQKDYDPNAVTSPSVIWSKTFNNSQRYSDFCGDPTYFDNLAVVDAWAQHNSTMAKFRVRLQESEVAFDPTSPLLKAYWGVRQALIRVGTCGRNCQQCTGPSTCTKCYAPYIAINNTCVCDSFYGIGFPTKTGCSHPCTSEQYYDSTVQSCVSCEQHHHKCKICNGTQCLTCKIGYFLYTDAAGNSNCKKLCPDGYGSSRDEWLTITNMSTGVANNGATVTVQRDVCILCPPNCRTCNYHICLFCKPSFHYLEGQCVNACPTDYFSSFGVCKPCNIYGDCSSCTASGCKTCAQGLKKRQGYCQSICIMDQSNNATIVASSTTTGVNTCSFNCSSPCFSCFGTSSVQCLSCLPGFTLYNHNCTSECPLRTWNNNSKCQLCAYGCEICFAQYCMNCIAGYFMNLDINVCVRICPSGYYPSSTIITSTTTPTIINTCQMCAQGCTRCINSTFCLTCRSNYSLFDFKCSSNHQDHYEWTNGTFQKCSLNCLSCRHKICTRCDPGYMVHQGVCVSQCPKNKYNKTVYQYSNRGVYQFAYSVCAWKNPLCQDMGQNHDSYSYYNDDSSSDNTTTDNQIHYVNTEECKVCAFTYPAAVSVYTTSTQTKQCSFYCPQFYTKTQNLTCLKCPDNCRRCKPDMTCLKCLDNYVINSPQLITASSIMNNTCVLHYCQDPYYSDSLQCQKCSFGCSQCLLDGSCHICQNQFTLDPNTKLCYYHSCSLGQYKHSATGTTVCHSCHVDCLSCYQASDYCTSCPFHSTTGIKTYLHSGTCVTTCPDGLFHHDQSRNCRKCDPRCTTCSSFRNCTTCEPNFYLLPFYDSRHTPCVPECPLGFWVNDTKCERCYKDCKSCYGPSQWQCLTCYPNFYLQQGSCVYFCPAMKYADKKSLHCEWCHPACQQCWGPTKHHCVSCKANNFFYNHRCFANQCPGATFLSIPEQRLCQPCQFGCQYCSSSQFCHFCTPGYRFYQGWCYLQCPGNLQPVYERYYNNLLGQICQGCSGQYSSNCQTCGIQSCQKCKNQMYLWKGSTQTVQITNTAGNSISVIEQCFSTCPLGTYGRTQHGWQCYNCSYKCTNCTSYSQCASCQTGYNLVNGYCTLDCPIGTYSSASSTTCSNCASTCKSCSSLADCTSCQTGLYLHFSSSINMTTCVSICPSTYFSDVSGWCIKCPSTCISCHNLTSCTQCKNGFSLSNNICINSTEYTCTSSCAQCNGGVCHQCNFPLLLLTNSTDGVAQCISNCPSGYYQSAFNCEKCNATCQTCNNTANNCTSCVFGLLKMGHKCLTACPFGFYSNYTIQRCIACPSHCLNCYNNTCLLCSPNFYLYNNTCYQQCPLNTFSSASSYMCYNCTSNCLTCHDIHNCTQCASGHILYNNTCITECPQHTFVKQGDHGMFCKPCTAPCFGCSDSSTCLSCIGGYILNGTICQQHCGSGFYMQTFQVTYSSTVQDQNYSLYSQCQPCNQHCLTCTNSSTNCLSCPEGSRLYIDTCVEECPDATFNLNGTCTNCEPACLYCSSQTYCDICISGAVNFNGTCLFSCPQGYYAEMESNSTISYNCTACSPRCKTCFGDSYYDCMTCNQGYYLYFDMCLPYCPPGLWANNITSHCQACPASCNLCTSLSNCTSCKTGFYLTSTNICTTYIIQTCNVSNCISCAAGTVNHCEQCITGYALFNGTCNTTCPQGYYTCGGVCFNCPSNCLNCTATGCTLCQSGYIQYFGYCYSSCPNGTIASGSTCILDPCMYRTSFFPYSCFSCASPYLLSFIRYQTSTNVSGSTSQVTLPYRQCVLTCPNGTVESGSQCVNCPFNCLYCMSQSSCTVCINNTYLHQGECKYLCPLGTYANSDVCTSCSIPFCLHCNNATNCTLCDQNSGAALFNGSCLINCPVGKYRDNDYTVCVDCVQGCQACSNASYCTSCLSGYFMFQGQCISLCPSGSYGYNGICNPCASGCFMCLMGNNCSLCQSNYSLIVSTNSLGSCVSTCPSGYYSTLTYSTLFQNTNTYICLPCASPCATCTNDGTTCTSCEAGYSLSGTVCSTDCGHGYYPIIQISTSFFGFSFEIILCFPCSSSCATCSSWSTCTSCNSGILDPYGNCISGCPLSTMYYDSTTRQCLTCSSTCFTCDGAQSSNCLSCNPPLQLFQGSCISQCPFGYYSTSSFFCQPCSLNCADCFNSSTNCSVCPEGAWLQNTTTGNSICIVQCGAGYFLNQSESVCQPCHSNCSNCTGESNTSCSACPTNYILLNGECIDTCPTGFALVSSTSSTAYYQFCQACPTNCAQCVFTANYGLNCTFCTGTLYLVNGSCHTNCPIGTYSSPQSASCIDCGLYGCQSCTFNSSFFVQCDLCQSGFLMMQDSLTCVTSCPSGYSQEGPYCVPNPVCTGFTYQGYCLTTCLAGTYANYHDYTCITNQTAGITICPTVIEMGTCLNCSLNCLVCISATSCERCTNTTVLYMSNSSSSCMSYCPWGYYNSSGVCIVCPSSCSSCFLDLSTGQTSCSYCSSGLYLLNGQCLAVCPSGYFSQMINNKMMCSRCSPSCAECVNTSSTCLSCKNANYTIPNCVTQVCTSGQYQKTDGTCGTCLSPCATCYGGNSYQCNTCVSGTFMVNGICVTSCPAAYYASGTTCIQCPTNCLTCSNSTTCLTCRSGFYYDQTTVSCVSDCSSLNTATMSYYTYNSSCLPCSSMDINCVVCGYYTTGSMYCSSCQSGSYLYQGQCYTTCPSKTYPVTSPNNICLNCTTHCLVCTSSGCTSCQAGYVVSNGQCSSSCPQGTFISTTGGISTCQSCGSKCDVCTSSTSCTSCQQPYDVVGGACSGCTSGYYYDSNMTICVQCSRQCASCSLSSSNCTGCSATSYIYLQSCVTNCPEGYYALNQVCTVCSTSYCSSCPGNSCQSCQSGYVIQIVSGQVTCHSSCPSSSFLHVSSNICHSCASNCLTCNSATQCTLCNNSTSLYLGYCLTNCPTGYTSVNNVCTLCLQGCRACSSLNTCTACNSGLTNNGNGTCSYSSNITCNNGYYANSVGNCSQCYPTCQTCSGGRVIDCLTCFSGSTFTNGICIANCNTDSFFNSNTSSCQLCSTLFNNCASCTETTCTSCTTNYTLLAGSCGVSCPNGTFMASGQCMACSSFCNICSSSTLCTQCVVTSPPIILYNGACHTSCPSQTYNDGTTCASCLRTCLTCSGSASNCSSCLSPYNLHGNSCTVSCPNGTYSDGNYNCLNCSSNCNLCSSATNCSSCSSPFYLVNGTCRSSCPTGYYLDVVASRCILCTSPCTQCSSRTNCSACQSNYTLVGTSCANQCGQGFYFNTSLNNCTACHLPGCGVCNATHCQRCASTKYGYYSNGMLSICLDSCTLQSTYADSLTMTCQHCFTNCLICTNSTYCTRCNSTHYLMTITGNNFNQCVNPCPLGYYQFVDTVFNFFPNMCNKCGDFCNQCTNANYCQVCKSHYYRYTTQNPNNATNVSCVNQCPTGYSNPTDVSGTGMCNLCSTYCQICLDSVTCTQCIAGSYVLYNHECIPSNCLNCLNCSYSQNICYSCTTNYYLYNNGCTSYCPNSYYPDSTTGKCEQCMANCAICFNAAVCSQCIDTMIFYQSTGTCQNQGFIEFGTAGNMSGFTSNITQIMATTYVATSAGPIAFGALTNTYGVMQVCQFMYLMAGSSDGNPQMSTFLDSLSICSYTNSGNTSSNSTSSGGQAARRLTAIAYTDSFLTTALPIFIMIACFISAYIVVLLFQKYSDSCCASCPCLQKYMRYTCRFMQRRFKYTYVDLVMWISYLPFLYFGLLQVKNLRWDTGLNIFSNLLAFVILIIYPFYPIFILRKIFDTSDERREHLKNYKAITLKLPIDEDDFGDRGCCDDVQCCVRDDPNTALAEMSLAPWIDKVVRPVYNQDVPEYAQFRRCTIPHLRLAYAAIKYFRKFLFVAFIAFIPIASITLGCLVGLSVAYLLYLFILRPKQKLYLILEIILQFLILGFEIFMLVYVTTGGATVTLLSIIAHAIGFAMANSTLAIAIILNIMAYYTIFCCIIDCIKHLKDSAELDEMRDQKEELSMDQKDDLERDQGQYQFGDEPINADLQKQLIRQFGGDDDPQGLVANVDLQKRLVRDFARNVDDNPEPVIPIDLEKKLVHQFGGNARDLVANNNLQKDLVRNIGRKKSGDELEAPVIPYDLEKKLVRDYDGERRPEELVKNQDLQKQLVRNFGRKKDGDDYSQPIIPYDMQKQLVRDFGGDQRAQELVKNQDLEKQLIRNFGRPDEQLEEPVIPYDLEKQLVRDFGGDVHPEDLIKNQDLEKDLVRNFGRDHNAIDDNEQPAIPYDLQKKLVRDFGGDIHPEELVSNNNLEKDLVRNFARPHNADVDDNPVIPYDLEKQLVRNFGGDERPEQLVENRDLQKDLVKNFGQNDGFVMPQDIKYAHPDLEKDLIKQYQMGDKQIREGNVQTNEARQRGDDQLTEQNNYDDIPLDHFQLDQKQFQFNMQGDKVEPKPTKTYDDYVEMPALKQTAVKGKKDKNFLKDPSVKSQQEMLVSGLSEDSSYNLGEGLIKDRKVDKYRRQIPKNQRISQQNYVGGDDSSSNLVVPGRKGRQYRQNSARVNDPFGQFEQILQPQKPKNQARPQGYLMTGPNMLVQQNNSYAQLGAPKPSTKKLQQIYQGSDQEDKVGEVTAKQRTNRYRRGANSKKNTGKAEKSGKGFAEDAKQSYQDVVNKNKQQVFKPQRKLNQEDFQQITYDRPERRRQRKKSYREDQASDEESRQIRKQRNSNIMKMYKKTGAQQNLGDHLELEEQSMGGTSHNSRKSKIIKPRGVKGSEILNIQANSELSEDIDEIKF